jgi:small-conductance mechanosensitive channel
MNAQTRLDRILSRLTPEYFAEKVLPGAVNVLVILLLMLIALRMQWSVAHEFNRRLKKAFDEKNIEMPCQPVSLFVGGNRAEKTVSHHGAVGKDDDIETSA